MVLGHIAHEVSFTTLQLEAREHCRYYSLFKTSSLCFSESTDQSKFQAGKRSLEGVVIRKRYPKRKQGAISTSFPPSSYFRRQQPTRHHHVITYETLPTCIYSDCSQDPQCAGLDSLLAEYELSPPKQLHSSSTHNSTVSGRSVRHVSFTFFVASTRIMRVTLSKHLALSTALGFQSRRKAVSMPNRYPATPLTDACSGNRRILSPHFALPGTQSAGMKAFDPDSERRRQSWRGGSGSWRLVRTNIDIPLVE